MRVARKLVPLAAVMALGIAAMAAAAAPSPAPELSPRGGARWALAAETPTLGRPGANRVGTVRISVIVPRRPTMTDRGLQTGDHALPVRLFYPAGPGGAPAVYRHTIKLPKAAPFTLAEHGAAFAGAPPLRSGTFPLVIVSHGFGGWDTHMSRLCEAIASHGYVVTALDHGDTRFNDLPGFLASFGQVLVARPLDQRTAVAALLDQAARRQGPLGLVDPARPIGLIGYSMGGYGALGTAGASYDPAAPAYAALPPPVRQAISQPSPVAGKIGALALLAPWGSQPDNRVWNADALSRVTAPVLLIDGDQDDVVNYSGGVRWLLAALKGSHRQLLTLQQAKHNIAGNQVDLPADASADLIGYFREPVWRQERLNQVLAHFLVAFLDANLKADGSARRYLEVPVEESNRGEWPVALGELTGATPAGDGQPKYWRGFARGWAVGMRLETRAKGE